MTKEGETEASGDSWWRRQEREQQPDMQKHNILEQGHGNI